MILRKTRWVIEEIRDGRWVATVSVDTPSPQIRLVRQDVEVETQPSGLLTTEVAREWVVWESGKREEQRA